MRCSFVCNWIVDQSDAVGASPVYAAPTTTSFSTSHLALICCTETTASLFHKHLSFLDLVHLYYRFYGTFFSWPSTVHFIFHTSRNYSFCYIWLLETPLQKCKLLASIYICIPLSTLTYKILSQTYHIVGVHVSGPDRSGSTTHHQWNTVSFRH